MSGYRTRTTLSSTYRWLLSFLSLHYLQQIYHEFGHAVMYTVSPSLTAGFIDAYGFNTTPGGLHEGYADLMTMFVTDDPEIGEYAGAGLGGPGSTAIRDIDNQASCPEDLVGESHADSLPFTGAVWAARSQVADTPEKKTTFDEALFAAQQGLGATDDFQTVAAIIVAEIETAFDETTANTVQAIFDNRGLNGCNNRVLNASVTKAMLYVGGTDSVQGPSEVPGPVQHKYELSEDAVSISITIEASQAGGMGSFLGNQDPPNLKIVIKGGGDPITWTRDGADVNGDYTEDATIEIGASGLRPGTGIIEASFPAGTYHLQVVNAGPTWLLQNISGSSGLLFPTICVPVSRRRLHRSHVAFCPDSIFSLPHPVRLQLGIKYPLVLSRSG